MKNPQSEMIWKGRLHLGDESGVYGDASYSGLSCQLPATLTKFAPAGSADDITFQVGTTDVQIFDPYPGHKVTIVAFVLIPNTTPQRFESVVVGETRITTSGVLSVGTTNTIDKRYFSVRVEVDTEVPPGLYDDFVFVSLSLKSTTHFADFGFRAI